MIRPPKDTDILGRHSIRLPNYDYSQPGAYFVTICTGEREPLLGKIVSDTMALSHIGQAVSESWLWLGTQHPDIELDEWIIMPNHLHGVITITRSPTKTKPIGRLVGAFKTVSTKRVNELLDTPGVPLWQRDFYEHIIRDDNDLNRIREYLAQNPARWAEDKENPNHQIPDSRRRGRRSS